MKLIIVESPTKAKTITRFLSDDFLVESCDGHIRDLPRGKMGIDLEHDFEPHYVIPRKKQKTVTRIKKAAKKAEKIYLATDEDREGEAISWHLNQIIKSVTDQPLSRISFHEITKEAIKESLKNPREINQNLFKAQQSRRILDRLVGYELSPLLWKKLFKGLSAGRVQSPALRLIVEREKEIKKFKPEEYWSIEAELAKEQTQFTAKLIKEDDKTIAKMDLKSESQVQTIVKDLEKSEYQVIEVKNKQLNKSPLPPFTTSTLQQEANKKLKFSVKQTMFLAQKLYEGIALEKKGAVGLITYPRTDALTLADKFLNEAEKFISQEYGEKYADRRHYKAKSKLAQEAHEAIRPTDCFKTPEKVKSYLEPKVYKLYQLIWNRAVASQMSAALINSVKADIKAEKYLLRANGSSIEFEGWLKLYPGRLTENHLPSLTVEEILKLIKINPQQHFTEPPPRFTEARLVKTLEEYGIGRPSTYSPIISTIQARNYVEKEQGRFTPTEIGILVTELLIKHFSQIVDYKFTAKMEDDLDKIARGEKDPVKMIKEFYKPFKENLDKKQEEIEKTFEDEITKEKCPKCSSLLMIKMGRFGKFMACPGFPKCRFTKSLPGEENKNQPSSTGVKCPKCEKNEIVKRKTRKGRFFYGCAGYPDCDFALWYKPTGEKCEKCSNLLIEAGKKIKCSNKECNFILKQE